MIAKGVPHAQGARLARYLITGKDRERAELLELRGFALNNIVDAFRFVHVMARATKCVLPFFHVSVRNPPGESLDAAQWMHTADAIEQSLGFVDQPRAIAFHTCEDTGESHMHVAWSRIDQDNLTAKPLPFFKERLKRVSREMERHFGLTEVPSTRKGSIEYAPTRREEEQSRRLGIDLRDHRETIRECFERSDCGRSFQRALEEQGMVLAKGERRDYIAIDRAGGMHALGKRILGMSAAKVRERFADLARDDLPTVAEVRKSQRFTPAPKVDLEPKPTPTRRADSEVEEGSRPTSSSAGDPVPIVADCTILEPIDVPISGNQVPASKEQRGGFAEILRREFRAAVKAIFNRTPSPQARRRKSGETVSAFRLAARRLLRPIVRAPVIAHAVGFLNDTLPWLHLWEWNQTTENDLGAGAFDADDNHPSPHP